MKRAGLLAASLLLTACAGSDECRTAGGLVFDITALAVSADGRIYAGGEAAAAGNCTAATFDTDPAAGPGGFAVAVSADRGASWQVVRLPAPRAPGHLAQKRVLGALATAAGGAYAAVNPVPGGGAAQPARLFHSSDRGANWVEAARFEGGERVVSLAAGADGVLVGALCEAGVLRSADHGRSWHATGLAAPATHRSCRALQVAASPAGEFYAYASGPEGAGFYRSDDGGRHWRRLPIAPLEWGRIAVNEAGGVVLAVSAPGAQQLFRSDDRGATWAAVAPPHRDWTDQLGITHDGRIVLQTVENLFNPGGGAFVSSADGRWLRREPVSGPDSLAVHPDGMLFAFRPRLLDEPPDWGGVVFRAPDPMAAWQALRPLAPTLSER